MKIYLSSTFEDLNDHRESVYRQLRSLRHDVIAMEDYVAADRRPLEQCLKDVRDSDVYIGIFAWRYGYVPERDNPERKSITELELLGAREAGKPCLLFLLKDDAPWLPGMMDATSGDNNRGAKISALRQSLREEQLVSFFESPDELATKVLAALYRWQMDSGAPPERPVAPQPPEPTPGDRATSRGTDSILWAPGTRLRVRFLEGSPLLRQRVMRMANIWSAYCNIAFVASDEPDAEVRLAFRADDGSWSYEGAMCLKIPSGERTMNLGWVDESTSIDEFESVVVHEFGHVLGLAHEHSNPDGNIPWKKETVYEQMGGPPHHWPRETVDHHYFTTWPRDRFPFTKPFDPLSIMAFPIPSEFTEDGFTIGRNLMISAGDKEFVRRLYPY